ncbi:MAG: hypothetical protein ACK5O2_15235 [Microthrixaceae bacterium]
MLVTCWSVKGGTGVSVVSAALAGLLAQRHGSAALVDLGGDQPGVLGIAEPAGEGVLDWCGSNSDAAGLSRLAVEVANDLVLVPRGHGSDRIAVDRAAELAIAVSELAPAVIIDAGVPLHTPTDAPGLSTDEHVPAAYLRNCGTSLFVTRACYLALKRATRCQIDADGVVLVAEAGRALGTRDVSDILGLPVIGVVEVDPSVASAVDAGSLIRRMPRSLVRGLRRAG